MQKEKGDIIEALVFASKQIQDAASYTLQSQITDHISWLILHDFEALIQILYRLDVNEEKLKTALQSNPDKDAAVIITDIMIGRQIEKWKTRQELNHPQSTNHEDADERW